jgi:malonyl-CoA/methylmalonyl-CoA synthetase
MNNWLYDRLVRPHAESQRGFAQTLDGRSYSYSEVEQMTGRLAAALVRLGLGPGDRVLVQIEKSMEAILLYLAAVRAGAVFVPVNPAYTPAEIAYFVEDAEPRLIVCDPARRDECQRLKPPGTMLETLDRNGGGSLMELAGGLPADFETVTRGEQDLAALLYTSGTTGRSKGAMLSHGNLVSNAEVLCGLWRFTGEDRLIHALPVFHTHGLFVATNVTLLAGAFMYFLPRFEEGEILRLLPEATAMMGVPTFYTRLLDCPGLGREAAHNIRLFVSGSAPLMSETHKSWMARTGKPILERYGMTETNMITSNPYDGERRPGSVGLPLPGVEVRVADPASGGPLAPGEVGEIEVRGPNVFSGYWKNAEKTRQSFRPDGYFRTGDLGSFAADGYLTIVGRSKDLIITGGFNVYPREVEAEIEALPDVAEVAVIGLPHPDFGEGVAALVVMQQGAPRDETLLMRGIGARLASYKRPKRIIFADALPRNTMGKVEKAKLRETHKTLFTGSRMNA